MKKEVSFSQCMEVAEDLTRKGIKWHSHVFFPESTPNCTYNRGNKFMLVLENEKTGEIFISKSRSQKEEDKKKAMKMAKLELSKTFKSIFSKK